MPPKTSLFDELARGTLYVDGKEISEITEITIEPAEYQEMDILGGGPKHLNMEDEIVFNCKPKSRIPELVFLRIFAPNNWLKMHGIPMKRKSVYMRKMRHFKRTMKQLSDI